MCSCALGNSWAIQCNTVGTDLALMQFRENWIHEAMWQRPAKCGKVNFLKNVNLQRIEITKIARVSLLSLIAKHPSLISFDFPSLRVEGISCCLLRLSLCTLCPFD